MRLRPWSAIVLLFLLSAPFQNCSSYRASQSTSSSYGSVIDVLSGPRCGSDYAPGHAVIHRLTNTEYNNSVRDLLFTAQTPADKFPLSAVGASGYSNDSTALDISDPLVQKYLEAAAALADEVVQSKSIAGGAYSKLAACGLTNPTIDCAKSILRALASKAYRRPVTEGVTGAELDQLMAIFSGELTFDDGLRSGIAAILMSTKFLFIAFPSDVSNIGGATYALDNYQLAARLSSFIWQSLPDDQLETLAAAGQLSDAATLGAQVERMLTNPKAAALRSMLRDEWLSAAKLSNSIVGLDDGVRTAMVQEADLVLKDVLGSNQPFINLFKSGYTYANQTLASYYGLTFSGSNAAQFAKVNYDSAQRYGILSLGAFLTANGGMGTETSIVKRGKAVTTSILCTPLGPPPVPPQDPNTNPNLTGNPRQRLIQATNSSTCLGCHNTLNNLGFGLEDYSSFGKFRTTYDISTDAIDSSGSLAGVISFTGTIDFLHQLPNMDSTKACFSQQLMAIATTRAVTSTDDKCVNQVVGSTTADQSFANTVKGIVMSRQFRMQTGESP